MPENDAQPTARDEAPEGGDVLRVLQSRAETRAFYNKLSRVYDLLAERSEAPIRRRGLELLAAAPAETMLEIGPGTGHCLVDLATAVGPRGRVYGLDLSEQMLQRSWRLLRDRDLLRRVELLCCDAVHMPLADAAIDGVFTSFTLELFDTPEIPRVLAECRRVLRPGGRLVVVALTKEGHPGLAVKAFEWTHRHFPNLLDCRPIYVERALRAAGFHIVEAAIEHMWAPVEIVLGEKPSGNQGAPPA